MATCKEIERMKEAQKIARKIELACDGGNLFDFFAGSHITTYPQAVSHEWRAVETGYVVFGDCPRTELFYDAKANQAWVYIGCGKARVPQRAIYELNDFFNCLHNS